MTRWNKVAGDVGDTLTVALGGVDNLDDASSVEAHVWSGSTATTLTAAVDDSAARTITVQLSPWLESATPARWSIEFEVAFSGGAVLTWPADRPDIIIVRQQGDPTP